MNKRISIIVPVYNCERYLEECIDSLLNQKYNNYEIILIDDGSTDNSKKICEKYAKKNQNIKFYSKKNGGVSNTRNYGIDKSTGDFICFVDSDDIVTSNFLIDFIENIKDSDTVMCSMKKFNNNDIPNRCVRNNETKKNVGEELFDFIFNNYSGYVTNKMYKREIILNNKIRFNEKIYMTEDLLFNIDYALCSKSNVSISNENYFYRYFSDSASKRINNTKWFTILDSYEMFLNNQEIVKISKYPVLLYNYNKYICESIYRYSKIDRKKYSKNISELKQKYKNNKIKRNVINYKDKVKLFCYRYFPNIFFAYIRKKEERNNRL